MTRLTQQIRVRGLVQGVGFRPTVWRLAKACGLSGDVSNDAEGVLIHVNGTDTQIDQFVERMVAEAPPLSRIDHIDRLAYQIGINHNDFLILESGGGTVKTGVVPDAATCSDCLDEIDNPDNRRYRYAFTNCTHCGPRLSIIRSIPYDRENTSMACFEMCADCRAEYENPGDRRFHAQPNACSKCGPRIWLENRKGQEVSLDDDEDALQRAVKLLAGGQILALKGIGGFHLACDATNDEAVNRLRQRKKRYHKAFALMAKDRAVIERYAELGSTELALLESTASPIVVLQRIPATDLSESVAPGQNSLGFMLPYTPLHHLLMQELDRPIVLTSGNLSEEPQVIDNQRARSHLSTIYDYAVFHDRDIVNRLDDSVARIVLDKPQMLRRARGYAPEPINLPPGFKQAPEILAMGSELKNTFCLIKRGQAIVSQHMGDLEDACTHADYRHNIQLYHALYEHQPAHIAVDKHPDYLSTQWGREKSAEEGIQFHEVQHHHAHISSCLAEHDVDLAAPDVLGVVLDGLGFGLDNTIWGGEFMRANYCSFERLARFQPVPMLGGYKAIKEPWRNTFAHLNQVMPWESLEEQFGMLPIVQFLSLQQVTNLQKMIERGLNAPLASSAGRLFDAVAAALGICTELASHEGQAAIEMEALVQADLLDQVSDYYKCEVSWESALPEISWRSLWQAILTDLCQGESVQLVATRFHDMMIKTIADVALRLAKQNGLSCVVLSGGVFQNRVLLEGVVQQLAAQGLQVLYPRLFPTNDGGVSLGQAVTVAARLLDSQN